MIRTPARFTIRALLAALFFTAAIAAVGVVVPAGAGAFALIEGPPVFSSAPGLPDGRVYELVSPANKNGNEAGAKANAYETGAAEHYGYASPDGDSVLFEGTGPMGESPSPDSLLFVARRSSGGWGTRALEPAARLLGKSVYALEAMSGYVDPAPDLSHAMVLAGEYALGSYGSACFFGTDQLWLTGSDPFVGALWLERPGIEDPVENCEGSGASGAPVGGSPDFSTVYFTYPGTLLPEDAGRTPHAHKNGNGVDGFEAWGFYEESEGVLREAGVLPDGGLDQFGAVPAASGHGRALAGNQVSADGSRAFFVSPDPGSCEQNGTPVPGHNNCSLDPPELYVREDGARTQLVSRDTLLAEAGGLPAGAPGGVLRMPNPTENAGPQIDGSYVFASADGSQAFFQSVDQLAVGAPEGPPGNTAAKTYDFDVDTGVLTYLPGVVGQIVATDTDGSSMAFVRPAGGGKSEELGLWSAGPGGGSVTPVVQLPGGGGVSEARMSSDGSVLVFEATGSLSGAFNSGGFEQVYRYDVPGNALGCVSCPPRGVVPNGDASISSVQPSETYEKTVEQHAVVDSRGVSADGDRVFFDTPAPLVAQDSNTNAPEVEVSEAQFEPQGRDVYEWENGVVYLISGGKSPRNSLLLDSSENGDDVFFATTEGLVPGDTDGGYDVYDARVPQPGDNPLAAAVPCEGSVCQGPPRVPSPLAAPSSATFSGLGNPASAEELAPAPAPVKSTTKTVRCAKHRVRRRGKCVKQSGVKKSARRGK